MKLLFMMGVGLLSVVSLHAGDASGHLKDLRAERSQLRKAITKASPDLNQRDPELAKLEQASIESVKAFKEAQKGHPGLTSFDEQLREARSRMVLAVTKKDEVGKKAAQEEIAAISQQRMEAIMSFPELQALFDAALAASEAWQGRKAALLARLPETRDLVKRMEELNREMAEESNKQRP